jgi:MFS transporter, PAT family, beta-lactamase induction signal transducer AmpG
MATPSLSTPPGKSSESAKVTYRNPWAWVSSLYLAEGLPYVVVMIVAVVMYKGMGISNTEIALYTSLLYLPWVLKPLWSPIVDILKTRRMWIWIMQIIIGGGLAGVALTIPTSNFFRYSLTFLWLLAFSSATQDIAIDGFYMLATTEKEQSFFVGIRSTFYRISTIFGQGLLVILAGYIQDHSGLPKVNLHVDAKPGVALVQSINQQPITAAPLDAELRIIAQPDSIEIRPEARPQKEVQSLIAFAKSNNVQYGFYQIEKEAAPSWWNTHISKPIGAVFAICISNPLESFLKSHFAPEPKSKSAISGNVGLVSLHLSKPPGRDVVVSLGSKVGLGFSGGDDKSFSVAEGTRLVFNDQNWNQPALAIVQLDPKLKTSAATTMQISSGNIPLSWVIAMFILAAMFLFFGIYHRFILPWPDRDKPGTADTLQKFMKEFVHTFGTFFGKEKIGTLLLFLLLYRFAEAQLVKMVAPFLLDAREVGGLGLTTGQLGFVYGTIGIAALTCGGLAGGMVASKRGLKFWLWWMVLAIHLPDAVFVYLSYAQPDNFWIINLCVAIEQFGYGFGFTAYMLYMIHIARGQHSTAHYAICTGFMALGMMIPGMFSGWLQDIIGYQHFFVWVLLATIPGFMVVGFIPLDPEFGKKTA